MLWVMRVLAASFFIFLFLGNCGWAVDTQLDVNFRIWFRDNKGGYYDYRDVSMKDLWIVGREHDRIQLQFNPAQQIEFSEKIERKVSELAIQLLPYEYEFIMQSSKGSLSTSMISWERPIENIVTAAEGLTLDNILRAHINSSLVSIHRLHSLTFALYMDQIYDAVLFPEKVTAKSEVMTSGMITQAEPTGLVMGDMRETVIAADHPLILRYLNLRSELYDRYQFLRERNWLDQALRPREWTGVVDLTNPGDKVLMFPNSSCKSVFPGQ